jgi:hypothetical protein
MGYEIVDKQWTAKEFREYLSKKKIPKWHGKKPKGVTLHHTSTPDLKMRPAGLTAQHQKNLKYYYEKIKGWSDGPHLFTDDDTILGMSGLEDDGVHAKSYNRTYIGIETLGDYNSENPHSGRGLACWKMTFHAIASILNWLGLEANEDTIKLHRNDPKTSKNCPGKRVTKEWIIEQVKALMILELDEADATIISTFKVEGAPDMPQTKPRIPNWGKWLFKNDLWYVPVFGFMNHIGGDPSQIISNMHSKDGKLIYKGDRIINSFYDRVEGTTYASVKELLNFD